MDNLSILEEENKELKDALTWTIEQFEKVLSGQKAGNVVESISYAKSLIKKKSLGFDKECPGDGNIRCIDCSCNLCDNNCTECNVEDCEPREVIYK